MELELVGVGWEWVKSCLGNRNESGDRRPFKGHRKLAEITGSQ